VTYGVQCVMQVYTPAAAGRGEYRRQAYHPDDQVAPACSAAMSAMCSVASSHVEPCGGPRCMPGNCTHLLLLLRVAHMRQLLRSLPSPSAPAHPCSTHTPTHPQGHYAFVIYDNKRKQAFAARDPSGSEPLYFQVTEDGGVSFASDPTTVPPSPGATPDTPGDGLTGMWVEVPPGHYIAGRNPKLHQYALTPHQLQVGSVTASQHSLHHSGPLHISAALMIPLSALHVCLLPHGSSAWHTSCHGEMAQHSTKLHNPACCTIRVTQLHLQCSPSDTPLLCCEP
jgi:hypothetical protein